MANNYDKIIELANANNMGLSNTIKRDFGIPLDFTSVQESYEAALTYAATNTLAYVGQPISVGDKLYIVTAESQGKYPSEVEEGGTQIDIYLAEVGSATEGDGKTIELKDGILSLKGIDGKTTGTYVPSLVNGVLTWTEPDTSTAEGQQQAIDALETRADALELTVNGRAAEGDTEAVKGLVDKVADNAKAISDEITARGTAIEAEQTARAAAIKEVTDAIGDITEGKTVVEMISDAETAAKNAIPTNVSELNNDAGYLTAHQDISGKADKDSVYTKTEVDGFIDGLEETIAGITHFTTKIVTSTEEVTEVGILYLIKDDSAQGVDKYNEYLFVDGAAVLIGDTTTDLTDYVTNDALATELAKYMDRDTLSTYLMDNYYTMGAVDTMFQSKVDAEKHESDMAAFHETVSEEIAKKVDTSYLSDNYYTMSSMDAILATKADSQATTEALAKKIETAQITHTTTGTTEGVTKEGTDLKIVIDSYTKAEVYTKSEADNKIDEKIASVTGGESAADVKLALESYRDAVNTEIWGDSAKNWTTTVDVDGKTVVTYTPQYGTTSRVDTLESDVATLKTNVTKAQTDATNAGLAISALETNKVDKNTTDILAIQTEITKEGGLSARIGALESSNTAHATEYAALKTKVDTAVDTTIPALTNRVTTVESNITTINDTLETTAEEIAKKANTTDVYTKKEVDDKVQAAIDAIPEVDFAPYLKTEDAAKTYATITDVEAIYKAGEGDTAATGVLADEIARATAAENKIADDLALLIENPTEALDSVKELIDHVEAHGTAVAGIITRLDGHDDAIESINESITALENKPDYVLTVATESALGGILSSKGDNNVTVDETGVATVATVNVNTLTQNDADILIIDGGSATDI